MKKIEKAPLFCGITLTFLFFLSLSIRGAIPYNTVFIDSFVRFGGHDPWYNMRLVENTLHHFPHRIYFDPFTAYPQGAHNPFGAPLFDLSLAFIIWVIGLRNPVSTLGQHGIEVIVAWYPAVLGALTVFPVYFIGKELYNRGTGLLSAALIAVLPGLDSLAVEVYRPSRYGDTFQHDCHAFLYPRDKECEGNRNNFLFLLKKGL